MMQQKQRLFLYGCDYNFIFQFELKKSVYGCKNKLYPESFEYEGYLCHIYVLTSVLKQCKFTLKKQIYTKKDMML